MRTPEKATRKIKKRTLEQLVSDFEFTNQSPMSLDLCIVRGWLMDELESRNPTAFERWIESSEDSPRQIFIIKETPPHEPPTPNPPTHPRQYPTG